MITHPQRCNRLWGGGRGLKVWSGPRREDFGELLECSNMVGRKMEARRRVQQCLLDICDTSKDKISSSGYGHDELGGKPSDRVADASCPAVPQPDTVAPI